MIEEQKVLPARTLAIGYTFVHSEIESAMKMIALSLRTT
jgi:NAD dependent epimerase/dehydratase family enzyme